MRDLGFLEHAARCIRLTGRAIGVHNNWDAEQLAEFLAHREADGTTAVGQVIRGAAKSAGVEPRELQEYEDHEWRALGRFMAQRVAAQESERKARNMPDLEPRGALHTWRDDCEFYGVRL